MLSKLRTMIWTSRIIRDQRCFIPIGTCWESHQRGFHYDSDQQAKMVGEAIVGDWPRNCITGSGRDSDYIQHQCQEIKRSFASREAGLSGRQRIFNVRWSFTPQTVHLWLYQGGIGQSPGLLATLRPYRCFIVKIVIKTIDIPTHWYTCICSNKHDRRATRPH